jgi:hypothetical protein
MCGLAGFIGESNLPKGQRLARAKALEALMLANASRGMDAAGVCMVHSARPQTIYKRAVDAYKLVEDKQFGKIVRANDAHMALGHTRLGTMGKNINRNAHPFKEGDVIGTHNGVIWNYIELQGAIDGFKPLRVDSQIAFRLIGQVESNGSSIAKVLPMLKGNLALVWHDVRDPKGLWVFKSDNPLSLVVAPAAKSAFWSSESVHLNSVMQATYGNNWYSVELGWDILYRFYWGKNKDGQNTLMVSKWNVDMPAQTFSKGKGYKPYSNGKETRDWDTDKYLPKNDDPKPDVDDIEDQITIDHCNMCHESVDYEDESVKWYDNGDYLLCGPCDYWWTHSGFSFYESLTEAIEGKASGGYKSEEWRNAIL